MRIGIVYFSVSNNNKLLNIVNSLSEGIKLQGHQVDIINGSQDVNSSLTVYNYIAIGTEGLTVWGGKILPQINTYLSNAGLIRGKRSYAFTLKSGLRPLKTLSSLMNAMEHHGMYLKKSDIISSKPEAESIGKRLHIN